MKKVRLLKLELTNYRNIEHEVYVFDGRNAKIVGENRIGKTNTLEAIYFLLSNYLLDGGSELLNLKPLSDTKKEVRVEGTFLVDEREIKLAKTYGEDWVKQRGTDTLVLKGHYEQYYVNGILQSKEKDYQNLLEEYFGVRNDSRDEVDLIQMLINPLYLGNLGDSKDWQKLRTYIVKMIGDVDDKEIFAKAPETKVIEQDLLNALGKTDQLKKMYANDVENLNTQLVGFDSKIELLEKTDKPTDEQVENAKASIEAITGKIVEMKSNNGKDSVVEQLEKEIFDIDKQIVEKNQAEFNDFLANSKSSEETEHRAKVEELNKKITELVNKYTDCQSKQGDIGRKYQDKKETREKIVAELKAVQKQLAEIDSQVLTECPTCHRPFEASEVEAKKNELVASLEKQKEEIISRGKSNTALMEEKQEEYKVAETATNKVREELEEARKQYTELNSKTFERPIFKESDELINLRHKAIALKDELTARKAKVSESASNNYELITRLESDKMNAQKVIDDRNYYDRQMALLNNVKAERKQVSNTLIMVEQKREALRAYLYTKLRLLDEHIAKVFGKLRFQLIKENINGGFDPVCKPYIYDVDKDQSSEVLWKSGSKSEKIATGIAIVEAIRKEKDLTELPFLFDEGGEVSSDTLRSKLKTNAQIICVKVEDNILKPIVVNF